MNTNIRCLKMACEAMGIPYQVHHHSGNLVQVSLGARSHLFINWATPLNPHSATTLSADKEFCYQLCHPVVAMPKTLGFLSPLVRPVYHPYLQYQTIAQIAEAMASEFDLPYIVKRNRGARGHNVFLCQRSEEVTQALETIFDKQHQRYDYVALAQSYIRIKQEYRVIILDGEIQFAYLKNNANAKFQGNLSPLHWENAQAELVNDPKLLDCMNTFLQPLFQAAFFVYAGLDLILDEQDEWWLLEANSAPSFSIFVRQNDPEPVIDLYKNMLTKLNT